MTRLLFLIISLATALSACSWTSRDDAPTGDVDLDAITDPIPRVEPLSASGNAESYEINGQRYYTSKHNHGFSQTGIASWYGTKFHGNPTASGEPYDMYRMTAAHKTLPLPSYVRVKNLDNGRQVTVRVNDRGPFVDGRIIDLSYVAALKLDVVGSGTARVEITALPPGPTLNGQQSLGASPGVSSSGNGKSSTLSQYYLQLGAFADLDNANRLVEKVSRLIQEPVNIDPLQRNDGVMLYRVRLGPYQQRQAVRQIEQYLSERGLPEDGLIFVQNP